MIVKICGITNIEDAENAVQLGANALGFIFVPSSLRYIEPENAAIIIRRLSILISQSKSSVTMVGVFVNTERAQVQEIIQTTGIHCLQLHGDETPAEAQGYTIPVWKSFRVSKAFDPSSLKNYSNEICLLDTYHQASYGGTGKTFDWDIAIQSKPHKKIILSGGINPDNVIRAIETVQPYGIDVNSGVEAYPGKKDSKKLELLFERMNTYDRKRYEKEIAI